MNHFPRTCFQAMRRPDFLVLLWVWSLVAFALFWLLLSLGWQYENDMTLFLFQVKAIAQQGILPYRDYFEMNAPGAIYVYFPIHWISQGNNLLMRLLDIGLVALILYQVWQAARLTLPNISRHALAGGGAMFILFYLTLGSVNTLQRESLSMPLLLGAFLLAAGVQSRRGAWIRCVLIGLLQAGAFLIKPPLILGFPVYVALLAILVEPKFQWRLVLIRLLQYTAVAGAAFACVLALVGVTMDAYGMLEPFLHMTQNYWPLYKHGVGVGGPERGGLEVDNQLVQTFIDAVINSMDMKLILLPFFSLAFVMVPLLVAWLLGTGPGVKVKLTSLLGVVVLAVVYFGVFILSNKFFYYHLVPVAGFAAVLFAVAIEGAVRTVHPSKLLILGVMLFVLTALLFPYHNIRGDVKHAVTKPYLIKEARLGEIREVVAFLEDSKIQGSGQDGRRRVLPDDVSWGALHVMYLTGAELSGSFIYNFHFNHHQSHPYIQQLQQRRLEELASQDADYVIQSDKAKVNPVFVQHLLKYYQPVFSTKRFKVYERLPKDKVPTL